MKIMPVSNLVHNKQNPKFSSYHTEILKNGKLSYKTHTEFLRQDFNWLDMADFVKEKYKNADKVNIVNHACSAGYEPWTLLIVLKQVLGNEFQKFMPIIARDIDEEAINYAKQGSLGLCYEECCDAYLSFRHIFVNNFNVKKRERGGNVTGMNEYLAVCNTDLKKNIDFARSDIFQDKELINKENTILLLRNCWPYFGAYKIAELVYFLSNNLKPTSLLAIGEYDRVFKIDELLRSYGFKDTNIEFLFEAPGKPLREKIEKFPLVRC